MSGICGLIVLDQRYNAEYEFGKMVTALCRFPHATVDRCRHGNAYLAKVSTNFALRHTSSDNPFQYQHWRCVSDTRLDDRSGCHSRLRSEFTGSVSPTDDELVAASFCNEKRQPILAEMFGDWVFSAWNSASDSLLLATQPYGIKSIKYVLTDRYFAFATSRDVLLSLDGLTGSVSHSVLAASLSGLGLPNGETLSDNIKDLHSGRLLIVNERKIFVKRYWCMEDHIQQAKVGYQEAVEECQLLVQNAIRARVEGLTSVATTMSSGFDSSIVSAATADVLRNSSAKVSGYCAVPLYPDKVCLLPDRYADESVLATTVANRYSNLELKRVYSDRITPIQGLEMTVDTQRAPIYGWSNDYWLHSLTEMASSEQNSLLLIGQMGNATLTWSNLAGQSLLRMLRQQKYKMALRAVSRQRFGLKVRGLLSRSAISERPWEAHSPMNPQFAADMRILEQIRDSRQFEQPVQSTLDTAREARLRLVNPKSGYGGKWEALVRRYGIDVSDPTADTRLVLFTLSLPENVFMGPTLTPKWFARQVGQKWLSEEVLNNRLRGYQAADLGARLVEDSERMNDLLQQLDQNPLTRYVLDIPRMRSIWHNLQVSNSIKWQTEAWLVLLKGLAWGIYLTRYAGVISQR